TLSEYYTPSGFETTSSTETVYYSLENSPTSPSLRDASPDYFDSPRNKVDSTPVGVGVGVGVVAPSDEIEGYSIQAMSPMGLPDFGGSLLSRLDRTPTPLRRRQDSEVILSSSKVVDENDDDSEVEDDACVTSDASLPRSYDGTTPRLGPVKQSLCIRPHSRSGKRIFQSSPYPHVKAR
ncbi:hypothetical protein BGZ94_003949, partial [Podila epigama]